MSVQSFEKNKILDLGYSLKKDIIKNNMAAASSSTTIVLCNTRSWHGLLSVYDQRSESMRVILSSLDISLVCNNKTFLLSTHKYPSVFFPLGHQYVRSATFNPFTCIDYELGNIHFRREMLIASNEQTLLLKATLVDSIQPVKLQIRPLVAFREATSLRRMSHDVITNNVPVENGIGYHLYQHDPYLYMQTNKPCDFITAPDWNYNVEYPQDQAEGKPYQEDLFMPGFFEIELRKGDSVVLSASMKNQNPDTLDDFFKSESYTRMKRKSYDEYIQFAANQMFCEYNDDYIVVEKMPLSPHFSKDRFGALPGLTLPNGNFDMFKKIALSYLKRFKNGAFGDVESRKYDAESPLWFVWAVQQYSYQLGNLQEFYKMFGSTVEIIVQAGMSNTLPGMYTNSNGLIRRGVGGDRRYYIDVNAMWYNAVLFVHDLASMNGKPKLADVTEKFARKIYAAFSTRFNDMRIPYLADSVDENDEKDLSCRPGQLVALALPYTMVQAPKLEQCLNEIETRLVTPVGLRGVATDDPKFATEGDITPYYLGFLAELYLKIKGDEGLKKATEIYNCFNDKLNKVQSPNFYEKFTSEPPYMGKGSPLSAVTIASINRIKLLIDQY